MIAEMFINEGHPITVVYEILDLSRSNYYYKPKENGKKKGAKPSEYTITEWGEYVPNKQVKEEIEELLGEEFVDYGYLKVTHWLRQHKGYVINPKKVYRLMRENGLLNKVEKRKKHKRNWVKELVPQPEYPFDYLEFDIKYMYVQGLNKNVLVLTVIDVESRWVLGQSMLWSIKQHDVIDLFDEIFEYYDLPVRFYVRNDNGSQFIADEVQQYFKDKNVVQEFCKPATPEQNAHIESYHSIVEKVVCQRYDFDNYDEIQQTMNRFLRFYNFERIHSGVDYTSPYNFLLKKGIDFSDQVIVSIGENKQEGVGAYIVRARCPGNIKNKEQQENLTAL